MIKQSKVSYNEFSGKEEAQLAEEMVILMKDYFEGKFITDENQIVYEMADDSVFTVSVNKVNC